MPHTYVQPSPSTQAPRVDYLPLYPQAPCTTMLYYAQARGPAASETFHHGHLPSTWALALPPSLLALAPAAGTPLHLPPPCFHHLASTDATPRHDVECGLGASVPPPRRQRKVPLAALPVLRMLPHTSAALARLSEPLQPGTKDNSKSTSVQKLKYLLFYPI